MGRGRGRCGGGGVRTLPCIFWTSILEDRLSPLPCAASAALISRSTVEGPRFCTRRFAHWCGRLTHLWQRCDRHVWQRELKQGSLHNTQALFRDALLDILEAGASSVAAS